MSAKRKEVEAKAAKAKKTVPVVEQARGELVEFPQPEKPAPVDAEIDAESARQAEHVAEEIDIGKSLSEARWSSVNKLMVDYDSIRLAELERGPLLRIFREDWRHQIKYQMSEEGGGLSLENACMVVDAEYGVKPTPDERFQELLNTSMENVSFDQLMRMYIADSGKAERYFASVKNEAQKEFATGHLAAKVFEPARWMETVWHRAQFLAVRDSYLAEFIPDGGMEYSLVDMLVQCYFMQQYWMEQTVERTHVDPRRESYEYAKWQEYKKYQAKATAHQWDNPTHWEIPYATQLQCIENAANMVNLFSNLYYKTLRQLNQHRMMKYKVQKLKAETRRINALTKQTLRLTQGRD
jgi:hypothetical protein